MTDPVDPAKKSDAFSADALRSLNFGPAWASGKAEQTAPRVRPERDDAERGNRREFGAPDRRDRRGFDRPRREFSAGTTPGDAPRPHAEGERAFRPRGDASAPRGEPRRFEGGRPRRDFSGDRGPRREGGERHEHRHEGHRHGESRREHFRPMVEVDIYPEEKPFGVLLKAVKASCRTYELFEIAKTILEKNERFVVSVKPLDAEKNPEARLWQSVPDQLPFLNEADAVAHVLRAHADTLFTAETVEVEPPKGAFTAIARCGFTGEFLAPPNYHGYQKTLREHFAGKIGEQHMSFERFLSRVETVKDEAAVAAWLESKKRIVRYAPKDRAEGEPEHFDSLEAVKAHLLATRKDKLVKALPFIRFCGKDLAKLPAGAIRASVEHEVAFQRKFPLDTANAIRGRLRKAGFSLYKRGAKGVTFLCGVKRKFRTPGTPPFSDDIQRVFDHIERTQDIAGNKYAHLSELPEKLLGIRPAEAPAPAAEGEETAPPAETAAPTHTPEETAKLAMLAQNIRWLVTEGYVTEFSDGRLFALPVMSEAQAKAAAAEDEANSKGAPAKPVEPAEPETSEDND